MWALGGKWRLLTLNFYFYGHHGPKATSDLRPVNTKDLFTSNVTVTVAVKVTIKIHIVSMVTKTLTGKMDCTPILSKCSSKTVTLTVRVNEA